MSRNERNTENITRRALDRLGYTEANGFLVEEQKSENPLITKLLKNSSKSWNGTGKPEFIVTKRDNKDFLIVIECKAHPKDHESKNLDQYKGFAVDGVLLYAGYLSKEFNVIAIAISWETEDVLKISTFLHPKNATSATPLLDEKGVMFNTFVDWKRYTDCATYNPVLARTRHANLMRFSKELHDYLRDYAKVTEAQKPLLVSGVLLALMEPWYERAYLAYEGEILAQKTFQAIKDVIENAKLGNNQEAKKRAVINAFSFIEHHPELHKIDKKKSESPLFRVVNGLHTHVKPFTLDHYDFDIIGNFYGEFIRYTGGDKQGLGIVLTPKHVTELFSEIAKVNKNSVVLDICAGTGGFLISAMKKMTDNVSAEERKHILEHSLIGIEQEPQMFALAVSNMILRGDGKTNLYQGSCFDDDVFEHVKGKASAGFINPPYSQKGDNLHEWDFIIRMLDWLQHNATGVAIVPMSLAIAQHPLREKLLKNHRLEAVMSMPDDLFYPVGVVSCILVFTAHTPHDSDEHHESWFGYWKDDGFRKDRVKGRVPESEEAWKIKKNEWVSAFRKKEIPGFSVWKKVDAGNEWCAESYLETDYSQLCDQPFINNTRDFAGFLVKEGDFDFARKISTDQAAHRSLSEHDWKWFSYSWLFELKKGKRLTKESMENGDTLFIGSTESNNGVTAKINREPIHHGNVISVTYNGSVGEAFYQPKPFWASDDVNVFYPKFELNEYRAMFLITLIRKEKYRFNYGRKWHTDRMLESKIKLPVTSLGEPDWAFMESYIKGLPFSGATHN